ncbi:MAG: fibronectin type III domain-containing protein [Lachnospiraceae bacterium]|nr:fibronectin type III domain-containing protein [Lachnospiraceae bacterium]
MVESIQSNANIKATTTISTDFVDSSYNVKVKSNTKGRTADETYEYVVESVSLDGAGNETRKIDIQRKLSSSDTSGLLGSVKVGYADLLDKKTNKFKDKNTVRYYVRQISGSDKDITYYKSEYMIEILVKLEDEDRKKVAADVKVYKDGVLTSLTPDKLSFENVYNAPAADVTTDQPKETTGKESVSSLKKPSSLKIIAKKKTLIVSWNKVKGAVSYQIQVSKKKSFKSAKTYIKKLKAGNKSKNISYKCDKLKKKTKYYVRVRAVDSKGNIGPWSKTLNKKTK